MTSDERNALYPLTDTRHGFVWGPVKVTRLYADPKAGVCVQVETDRQIVELRATPSGLLRVDKQNRVKRSTKAIDKTT